MLPFYSIKKFAKCKHKNIAELNFYFNRRVIIFMSHQVVNVYGKPELKYEITSEDTAVDIQIHTDEND